MVSTPLPEKAALILLLLLLLLVISVLISESAFFRLKNTPKQPFDKKRGSLPLLSSSLPSSQSNTATQTNQENEEPRTGLCYLILAHTAENLLSFKVLIEQLWEPHYQILLMMDHSSPVKAAAKNYVEHLQFLKSGHGPDPMMIPDENGNLTELTDLIKSKRKSEMSITAKLNTNIHFAVSPYKSTGWGGSSVISSEQFGFRYLWKKSSLIPITKRCEYYILISGDSFPLVSNKEIERRLRSNKGISVFTREGYHPKKSQRFTGRYKGKAPPPPFKEWQFSSQWVTLHKQFMEFALFSEEAELLLNNMKEIDFQMPDESFYPTLFDLFEERTQNTTSTLDTVHSKLCRYEIWALDSVFDPEVFGSEKGKRIEQYLNQTSSPSRCIFGRKFRVGISNTIYKHIINSY